MNRRAALLALAGSIPAVRAADPARIPILVELFTSEGCSSCPPADVLLSQLERHPPDGVEVIALAEHVDYWNHLGWVDAYSSPVFTARQQHYATRFRVDTVYTPQMVIDGHAASLGSDPTAVYAAIAQVMKSARAAVRIELTGSQAGDDADSARVRLRVEAVPGNLKDQSFDVMLAVTESGLLSQVSGGENAGRQLSHTGVVRSLTRIAELNPRQARGYSATLSVPILRGWNRHRARAVLFVQGRDTSVIAGAASAQL